MNKNALDAGQGIEGKNTPPCQERGFIMTVPNAGFVREIAEFIGADNPCDTIDIGVQVHYDEDGTEYRFVLVNSTAVLLDDVCALIDAILEAKAVAAGDLKAAA